MTLLRRDVLLLAAFFLLGVGYVAWAIRARKYLLSAMMGGVHSSDMTVRLASWLALRRPDLLPLIDDKDDTPEEVAEEISEAGTVFFPAARYNVVLCVNQMRNARVARQALERLRATAYDASNGGHEQLLVKLWAKTFPSIRLDGRISEQWKDLGFQGTDPATDFRGGGILSLLMMIYTADYHTPIVRTILRDLPPTDMKSWYPYAVASINLTCDLMRRVASGKLDDILYAAPTDPNDGEALARLPHASDVLEHPALLAFGKYHAKLFEAFHQRWMTLRPPTMEFNIFKEQFYTDRGL